MNKRVGALAAHRSLSTPTALSADAVRDISAALTALLADDVHPLPRAKNFHWHMSGRISATTICLLDDQGDQSLRHDRSAGRTRAKDQRHDASFCRARHVVQRILDNDAAVCEPAGYARRASGR